MFVSFLLPRKTRGYPAHHLMMFYKQLGHFQRDDIAFVGLPEYFREPETLRAEGRGEWQEDWCKYFDYRPPTSLDGVQYHALPADLLTPRLRRLRSPLKLYHATLTERLPELERAFTAALDDVAGHRPIDAVLSFANVPSIQHVAQLRGVPVVHNEIGPLRKPVYQHTAYWDTRGVNGKSDAARRYRRFRSETAGSPVRLFSRSELLHIFRRTPPPAVPSASDAPYRIGVALQVEDDSNSLAYARGLSALDMLMMARYHAEYAEILVRSHPAGLFTDKGSLGVPDHSPDTTTFIQSCATILTVNSSTALEAALLGRRVVVLGDSPFRLVADRWLDTPRRRSESEFLRALNFLLFGYLVPYELMFDPSYMRWRLGNPPEREIYRHHQTWFLRVAAAVDPRVPVARPSWSDLLDRANLTHAAHDALVIFGAGAGSAALIAELRLCGRTVSGLFDNDPDKRGTRLQDVHAEPPIFKPDTTVLIASLLHADEMQAQLKALGYAAERIVRLDAD